MSVAERGPHTGRLLLVAPSATSFLTFLTGVAEEWRLRGGAVAVAAGPELAAHPAGPWPVGVERLSLPPFRTGSPAALIRAAVHLRRYVVGYRPDIVHAHFAAAVLLSAVVRSFVGEPPRHWIGTFHGLHAVTDNGTSSWLAAAAERWSARRMTEVCVLNAEDEAWLRSRNGGVPVHRLGPYGVGCDLTRFDPDRFPVAERERLRQAAGVANDSFVIAFVGRPTRFKGFDAAVHAYRSLRDAGFDATLLIVGVRDHLHDTGLSAADLHQLEQDPRVVRTGWQADVSPWLAIADCCLLPSHREGMPVSLMESLALGVPAITVASRGCREVVRDGIDGFVLPEATAETIAAAVRRLAADRRLWERMREAAIAGRGRFDRRACDAAQVELYDHVTTPVLPHSGRSETIRR